MTAHDVPPPPPPTLHLVVGLPGAGKTTLARRLEHDLPALRLTPDEWIAPLYGDLSGERLDAVRDPVEAVQWAVAARALALGARSAVHGLLVPRDELWARLERRNAELPPHTFAISRAQLDAWWALFEPPGADELRQRPAPDER